MGFGATAGAVGVLPAGFSAFQSLFQIIGCLLWSLSGTRQTRNRENAHFSNASTKAAAPWQSTSVWHAYAAHGTAKANTKLPEGTNQSAASLRLRRCGSALSDLQCCPATVPEMPDGFQADAVNKLFGEDR